jgi:hypothetical protein
MPCLLYLFVLSILISIYRVGTLIEHESLAATPSVVLQEMKVIPHKWIDILNKGYTYQGDNYTKISSVSYFSDGRTLNATLWLTSFNPIPRNERVDYGIFIDADSNKKTGKQGIDYNVEIQWNGTTKSWTKIIEQYSSSGGKRTLSEIHNYRDFFGIGDRYGYVLLSSDVNSLGFSNHYKVLFYAGQIM